MSTLTPHSKRFKLSPRPLQGAPVKPLHTGRHATVNCHACNRIMVPRVISYYGQPLRSICPFCGTTFMKFSSGLQQLMKPFQTRSLSFMAFKWMIMTTLIFGLLWSICAWAKLPDNLNLITIFGTIGFGLMAVAELFVQCIEHLAAGLSHESNYYWSALVLIIIVTANFQQDLNNYLLLFSALLLLRWVLVGSARALFGSK